MADAGCVKVSHEGPVAVLSIEFAPHNLLGLDLMAGMRAGLNAAQEAGARAVLLKSGLRHFSAGADTSLFVDALGPDGRLSVSPLAFLQELEAFPLPIVAAVQGACIGGGLEMALACDLIVAAEGVKFTAAYVKAGLVPDAGLTASLARLVPRALAMEMMGLQEVA